MSVLRISGISSSNYSRKAKLKHLAILTAILVGTLLVLLGEWYLNN